MTKQEEILKATQCIKGGECIYPDMSDYPCSKGCVRCYLDFLVDRGVVIKVDKELPDDEWFNNLKDLIDPDYVDYFKKWTAAYDGQTVGERQVKSYLAQAGYVAVEPLIKEE